MKDANINIATADGHVNRRDPIWLSAKRNWVPSWGGKAAAGPASGGTVNSIWQGIKNALGAGSDDDQGSKQDEEEYANTVPNSPYDYAPPYPQAQNSPSYPQAPNAPQWWNAPQSQNGPNWVQPPMQKQSSHTALPDSVEAGEPETTFQDGDPWSRPHEESNASSKPDGASVTLSGPVVCRKFPDTVVSSSWSKNVYAGGSKIFVNCWTTASMPGALGKVENSPIWLKTDRGCYISDSSTDDWEDFQSKIPFCVTPTHWAATARPEYEAKLECYQCPTLKCPTNLMSKSTTVDVQCIVDGEDARGNSTWVKPIDQNCYLPGDIFTQGGWLGKS